MGGTLNRRGFTLIEMMMVVGLVALLLVGVSNLFLSTLRGGSKVQQQTSVKDEAEYALITMERVIRGGDNISPEFCDGSEIVVEYPDSPSVTLKLDSTKLKRSDNGGVSFSSVTSDSVEISNLNFKCDSKSDAIKPDVVTIDFDIGVLGRPTEHYDSVVTQRNASSKL